MPCLTAPAHAAFAAAPRAAAAVRVSAAGRVGCRAGACRVAGRNLNNLNNRNNNARLPQAGD